MTIYMLIALRNFECISFLTCFPPTSVELAILQESAGDAFLNNRRESKIKYCIDT
jgi:hypothetical protein